MQKRLLTLLLLASMLLAGCSGEPKDTESRVVEVESGTETESQTEEPSIVPDFSGVFYDDATFHMLSFDHERVNQWVGIPDDILSPESSGNALADSVYHRNLYVEDTLGVKLVSEKVNDAELVQAIRNMAATNDNSYDLAFPRLSNMPALAEKEYVLNLHTMSGFTDTDPWWDERSIEALTVQKHLYGVVSDATYIDKLSSYVVFFNQPMVEDYHLGDMYTLVEENEWTFDKMLSFSAVAAQDVNNDGAYDQEDAYGLSCQNDASYIFLNAANSTVCGKDTDGKVVFTLGEEATVGIMQQVYALMDNGELFFNRQKFGLNVADAINMFIENRTMMLIRPVQTLFALREMDADFGIIPVPKYTAEQQDFGTAVNPYTATFACLPATLADPQKSWNVLTCMAAKSHESVMDTFYQTVLGEMLSRDPKTATMLDIIFGSRIYDLGMIWDFSGVGTKMLTMNSDNVVSRIASMSKSVNKKIDSFNSMIAERN